MAPPRKYLLLISSTMAFIKSHLISFAPACRYNKLALNMATKTRKLSLLPDDPHRLWPRKVQIFPIQGSHLGQVPVLNESGKRCEAVLREVIRVR